MKVSSKTPAGWSTHRSADLVKICHLGVSQFGSSKVPMHTKGMFLAGVRATLQERKRSLPADLLIPDPAAIVMHAVTIAAPPECVWPWLVQRSFTSSSRPSELDRSWRAMKVAADFRSV